MSANFLDDLELVDPSTVETGGQLYPVAQWLHGDTKLAASGGVAHTGGIILPEKYIPGDLAPPPGWPRTRIAFNNGKAEEVLAAQHPRLAVVRTRFRWFVNYNGVTTFYPRAAYVASSGMRGHLQVLCGIRGFDFPIVVTFKGKASQAFETMLREFSQKTAEASARLARVTKPGEKPRRFPRFAFYLALAPGPHVKVGSKGQESLVTPPVPAWPEVMAEEYLGKAYVGREKLMELQQVYLDAADWVAAWDQAGAETEADDAESDDEGASPAAPEGSRNVQAQSRPSTAPERPVDSNGLRAKIATKRLPSAATDFLGVADGPTVFWTTARVFDIDQQLAEDIRAEAKGDWAKALAGLDAHAKPF
jgi:hypothetical protein